MAPKSDLKQASPIAFDADDQTILNQTAAFYHETLMGSPEALDYLKARGLDHPEAIERFKLGYANRTLGLCLPDKQWKAGAEIRGRLADLGIYRDSGHEHLNGSLVIPVIDEAGNVVQMYGRKLLNNLRKGTPLHLYLPGPLKGVWNLEALKESKNIILAKSLMDALSFWCAGHRNVTAANGVDGVTEEHLCAFERHSVKRVFIAFGQDEAADHAARKLAESLRVRGISSERIHFPTGMDANRVLTRNAQGAHDLGQLIHMAEGMGNHPAGIQAPTQAPAQPITCPPAQATTQATTLAPAIAPSEGRQLGVEGPGIGSDLPHEIQGTDLFLTFADRKFRVRGWQKPLNPETLKVNLMVSKEDRFHVDTLDLYHAKARTAFIRQAGMEVGVSEEALKHDLGKVLRKVEALQADQLAQSLKAKDQRPPMTEAEEAEALALLKSPNLMDRILQDFESLGVVGEESNKLTGYLSGVSRLLDRPLALLVQSASAAGKTSLIDSVLALMPPEDVVRYSAMSSQSLFYLGNRNLRNKILAIAEEEGARDAGYALKLLQSEGKVSMASTGKDTNTGLLTAHEYTVEGPVSLFLTTTNVDVHEELQNRSIVLTVDESRAQTRAIHAVQRSRETLEGLLAKTRRDRLTALHRNAQRLLEPLAVVNPYAEQLRFHDHQTRSRRDQTKYLTLIRSIALLHQFQREVKTLEEEGRMVRYIEVTPQDIALANTLAQEVLGRTVDELQPQTRKLLTQVHAWAHEHRQAAGVSQQEFRFTRRQVRQALGWGDTQLKVHLARLVELEYLLPHRHGHKQPLAYELLYQGEDAEGRARVLGLIEVENLDTTICGRGAEPKRSGSGRASVGDGSGTGQIVVRASKTSAYKGIEGLGEETLRDSCQGLSASMPSQTKGAGR